MQGQNLTPSKILFFLCISFAIGIFAESVFKIQQIFVCGFLLLGVGLIMLSLLSFPRKRESIEKRAKWIPAFAGMTLQRAYVFGFCILFFAIGILRMQITEFSIENDQLRKLNGTEEVLRGIISGEPDERDDYQNLKISAGSSTVLVTTNIHPKYNYLDSIEISGKLEAPRETEDFSYKNYLMKDGIYSVMFYPKITKLNELGENVSEVRLSTFERIYSMILWLKQKIRHSIQYSFSPPESSILEGTILGDNGAMSDDLKTKLNATGLRHIIAVSGTHVVILSALIMSLLIWFGLKRGDAFWIALIIIFLYVVFTGLPASGVRAGIMGGLYLTAQKIGRQSFGVRAVVLAGAAMLIFNPLLLAYDVGFQLSFLAVIGLIFLEPPITAMIKIFTKGHGGELLKIISTTFAAQIFTLPVMLYNFGNISLVAPITNLLVLPVVYWLMVFGFVLSFAGIFWSWLGWILSVPCYILLKYFLWVINFFSQPWAIKTFENVHWIWLIVLYLPIIALTKYLHQKFVRKF